MKKKGKKEIYPISILKMTRPAAAEAISRVLIDSGVSSFCVATVTYEIMSALGFK